MESKLLIYVFFLLFRTSFGTRASLNVTVTRGISAADAFAFTSLKEDDNLCQAVNQRTCAASGGLPTNQPCNSGKMCCKMCRCAKNKPTYLVQKNRCVSNMNFTTVVESKPGCKFYLTDSSISSRNCSKPTFPTLDTRISGKRKFAICEPDDIFLVDTNIVRCEVIPHKSYYLDNGKWISLTQNTPLRRVVKHGFIFKKLELQWGDTVDLALHGRIMSLAAECVRHRWGSISGLVEIKMESCLFFKTAGTRTWPGPPTPVPSTPPQTSTMTQSTHHVITTQTITTNATQAATAFLVPPTKSTESTETQEREDVARKVSGDFGLLLIVVAAVLGSLLVLVFVSICVAIVFYRKRRRRANLSQRRKKNASNPVYERGPDRKLIRKEDSRNTSMYTNYTLPGNFYQPLVENTRPGWGAGKDPIYQSLDEHARSSHESLTDANRVSLPYCDMTDDGYLVPVDGHTNPTPPLSGSEGNTTDMTNLSNRSSSLEFRPRVCTGYDEPEGILKDKAQAALDNTTVSEPEKLDSQTEDKTPDGESTTVGGDPPTDELAVSTPVQSPAQLEVPHTGGDDSDNDSYYEDMKDFTLDIEDGKPFYFVLQNSDKGTQKPKEKNTDTDVREYCTVPGEGDTLADVDGQMQEAEENPTSEAAKETDAVSLEAETLPMHCACQEDDSTKL